MSAKGKQKAPKAAKKVGNPVVVRVSKGQSKAKVVPRTAGASSGRESGDLAAEVKRLAREVEAVKAELGKRSLGGGNGSGARRDQDKVVADRLARLDEKVDSVWNRLADLEERLEGDGAGHGADDDFEEPQEKDFYDR